MSQTYPARLQFTNPLGLISFRENHKIDQTYNEGEWNRVIIRYINGSGEYSISVNGAEFETYFGVSSQDNGSGGNLDGFRLQGDSDGTVFYLDGMRRTEHAPINLKYVNFGGVSFKAIEGNEYEIQVSHDLKQWSKLGNERYLR